MKYYYEGVTYDDSQPSPEAGAVPALPEGMNFPQVFDHARPDQSDRYYTAKQMQAYARAALASVEAPVDMILHCPACHLQHIDAPEGQFIPGFTAEESMAYLEAHGTWANPPHRSHLCHRCGHIWRPADVATNGVKAIKTKGKADSKAASVEAPTSQCLGDPGECAYNEACMYQCQGEQVPVKAPTRSKRDWRIYIAGPMTGLPEYNFPAFNAKATELRAQGWHVENPAEHGHVEGAGWADYLRWGISRIATCGAIYILPGWESSKGESLEVTIGKALGVSFYGADSETPTEPSNYEIPEWAKQDDLGGRVPSDVRVALREAFNAGKAIRNEEVTPRPTDEQPLVQFRVPKNRDEAMVLLRMASSLVNDISAQFGSLLNPEPAQQAPSGALGASDSLREPDGRCGMCGGDWSVCGCQGMVNRSRAAQKAVPKESK